MLGARARRTVLIATVVGMAALLARVALVRPRQSDAAPRRPVPTCCIPDPGGPAGFGLNVAGTIGQGATVVIQSAQPGTPGLIIVRALGNGQVEGPDPTSDSATGVVPLGLVQDGATQIPWDLTLNGNSLPPGTYVVFAEWFEADGRPAGYLPSPQYAQLTIDAYGEVSVQMGNTVDLMTRATAP